MHSKTAIEQADRVNTLIGGAAAALEGVIPDRYCDGAKLGLMLTNLARAEMDNLAAAILEEDDGPPSN